MVSGQVCTAMGDSARSTMPVTPALPGKPVEQVCHRREPGVAHRRQTVVAQSVRVSQACACTGAIEEVAGEVKSLHGEAGFRGE